MKTPILHSMNRLPAAIAALLIAAVPLARAANVSLKANDQLGTTSWTGTTNWDGLAPSATGGNANDYFTKNFQIRTPDNAAVVTNFGGLSLSIDPGGTMNVKHRGHFTNNNLILNGGSIGLGGATPSLVAVTNWGTIRLNATTNTAINTDTAGRSINIASTIIGAGTATLLITNITGTIASNWPGVTLSGANTFSNALLIRGNSVVKANHAQAFGSTNGFTTVDTGSMIDLNGLNLGEERFIVNGAGTNSAGVLINRGTDQLQATRFVTLSGDATFGGSGRWDVRNPGAGARLVGAGFTLTKVGGNYIALVGLGDTDLGNINVNAGTLSIEGSSTLGRAANTLTVAAGAMLTYWGSSVPAYTKNFVLNGGTIRKDNGVAAMHGTVSLQTGSTFQVDNTSGTDLTVHAPISGPGSLIKSSTGHLILNGTNTYTGNTLITGGKLVLGTRGFLTASPYITVNSGTVLDVTAVSGGFSVAGGQTLQGVGTVTGAVAAASFGALAPAGDGGVGTLLITNGALSLQHQGSLRFDLSGSSAATGGGVNDLLVVNGNLSLSGSNSLSFSVLGTNSPLVGVPYTIILYSGTLSGGVSNLVSAGLNAAFDLSVPGQVRVTFTGGGAGANLVWKGDGAANVWNTGVAANWLNGILPSVFNAGDIVTFDDTGSNNVPVAIPGPVSPLLINVTASNRNFTLSGPGSIASGSLIKTGTNTLILSTTNTHGGGTFVGGGTLRVGVSNALGAANSIVVATNGGQIDLNGVDQSSRAYSYFASGAGPDGLGAVKNTTGGGLAGGQSGIRNLTLVGDTTVGTIGSRFDLGGGGGVNGGGYALTKVGTAHMPFRGSVSNLPVLNVNAGRFYSEQFSQQITGVVNVAAGAMLGAYAYTTPGGITNSATVNLNGGHLGAESAQSDNLFAVWQGPVNVNAWSFLNAGQAGGNSFVQIEGPLSGSGNLTVANSSGTKPVILTTNNDTTYSGNVTINSGNTLRLAGGDATWGTGGLTNLGTLQFLRSNATVFNGANLYSSNGTVIHEAGSGQLTLGGAQIIGTLIAQSTNAANPLVIPSGANHYINYFGAARDNFYGKVQIDAGANLRVWSQSQGFWLGEQSGRAGEVVQNGGDVVVDGGLRVGHWGSESSLYTMNGGTLTLPTIPTAGGETPGILTIGVDGTGAFRQTGGTVYVAGVHLDNRGDTAGFDTLALEGGRLIVGPFGIASGNPSQTNFLGGGTLEASAGWASSLALNFSGTNGNVTIDPGLNTITLSGNLAGPGGFNKTGPGTLVLSGNSLFTNFSSVNQGLVLANGQVGTNNSTITVNSGGILGGSGNVRPAVIVNSGGTLTACTNGFAGTLTVTNHVTLNSGAAMLFDLAAVTTTGGNVNDLITVRSNLTFTAPVPVMFNFLAGAPNTATPYTLMQYGGTLTGDHTMLVNPSHYGATFGSGAGVVTVQFSGAASNLTWIGDGVANLWDAGVSYNWTNGVAMDFFGAGDIVTFDDSGSNNVPVTLAGNLAPSNVLVNAAIDYNFAGAGRLVGAMGLTKSGAGTLTLTNGHDFTGNLNVNGGNVIIGGDSSLGTAPLAYAPGKIALNGGRLTARGLLNANRGIALGSSGGTLAVPAGEVLSFGGIITNVTTAGSLTKSGAGRLRLNSANAYTGNTIISQGDVVLQNNFAVGSNNSITIGDANTGSTDVSLLIDGYYGLAITNPITVSASGSGTVRIGSTLGTASNPRFTGPMNINRDITLISTNTDRTTFEGPISGTGNLTISGGNRVALAATNPFNGNVSIVGAGTILQPFLPGGVNLAQTIPDTATVNVDNLAVLQLHGDEKLDRLTGTGIVQPIARDAILYVGANNGSSTFDGLMRNNGNALIVAKVGSGTFSITNRHSYTGNTLVNGGTLALINGCSISNSAQISVNSNAVLDVSGLVGGYVLNNNNQALVGNGGIIKGNFALNSNSVISPAGIGGVGQLSFSNNFAFSNGANVNWNLTNSTVVGGGLNDLVVVLGDVIINGRVNWNITQFGNSLAVGTYRLINYSGNLIGNATNIVVANLTANTRYTYTIDTNTPGQLNLVVGSSLSGNLVWRGNVNANWNINTDANWLNAGVPDKFFNGDSILFDDSALQLAVNLPVTVLPGPITISNTQPMSTVTGAGKISGPVPITKLGSGLFTLAGVNNDFTGPVTVGQGIFRVSGTNALGVSSLVTVSNGAQFDLAGAPLGRQHPFVIEGFGPDGRGAIISSTGGGHGGAGSANPAQVGSVTLTGDAGIWSAAGQVWDFFGGVFDGRGYKLYKQGAGRLDIFNTRVTNLAELVVSEGVVYTEGGFANNLGTNATVAAGATLGIFANAAQNTRVTLNGGWLMTCGNTLGAASWTGPITINSNSTMGYFHIFNSGGTLYSNHMQIDAEISGAGGFTKVGTTNYLFLAGTNTYTGNTMIQEGRVVLLPTGSISNSAVIDVRSGAVFDVTNVASFGLGSAQTLAGVGTVLGNVTAPAGSSIKPGGAGTVGTLTLSSNLVLAGASPVFDLSSVTNEGSTFNDLLNVRDLDVVSATTIRLNPVASAFSNDTYVLINYSGTLNGQANLSVAVDAMGIGAVLDFSVPGKVRVTISGTPGGQNLVWLGDYNNGGTVTNWDVLVSDTWHDGGAAALFYQLDSVTFNDDWANSTNINLVGTLAPATTVISSADNPFSFLGSGNLGGAGSLVKAGLSEFTIANSGANTWSGPTVISGGTLRVGNGGTAGTLPSTPVTNNQTLIFNRADNISVGNLIEGIGSVQQSGPGVLTLSGSNPNFLGSFYVAGGTLKPSSAAVFGTAANGIIVQSGGTLDVNGQNLSAETVTIAGAGAGGQGAVINSGADQITAFSNLILSANATVGGTTRLEVRATNTVLDLAGFTLTKTGLNQFGVSVGGRITDGNIVVNQGTLNMHLGTIATGGVGSITVNTNGILNVGNYGGRLNVSRPIVLNNSTIQAGGTSADLDSPFTITGGTVWDAGATFNITNAIAGAGRLTKIGGSTLVLGGENTYSGGTVVNAGVLQVGTNGTGSIIGELVNNATVTFANSNPVVMSGGVSGFGTLNQAGGPLRLIGTNLGNVLNVQGRNPTNYLVLAAGSSNVFPNVNLGQAVATTGASGSMLIEPGAALVTTSFMMGQQNTVTGNVVQLGGDVWVSGQYRLGHWPNSINNHLMAGGSLNITNAAGGNPSTSGGTEQNGALYLGIDSIGVFTQTGGVINAWGVVLDNRGSTPALGGVVSTYTMEGGSLNVGPWGIQSGSGNAVTTYQINLGGGTVGSLTNWASTLRMTLTGTNGDVVFNPGAYTNVLAGALSGSGGLKKLGSGALFLNGFNSHLGMTAISNGVLGGLGSLAGPLVVAPSGILAPGTNSVGTFTISNTVALSGTVLSELMKLGSGRTCDVVRATGTITYGGTLVVSVAAATPAFAEGDSFRLFEAPSYSGTFSSYSMPTLAPGLSWETSRLPVDGTITVVAAPFITLNPVNQTANCGGNASFTAAAGGLYPAFQWYRNGSPVIGGTNATLNLTAVTTNDSVAYFMVAANAAGSATSTVATVTVTNTPVLISPAGALAVGTENNACGSMVLAGGSSYRWEINDATGGAGTGWDLLNVTGDITVEATSGNPFVVDLWSLNGVTPGLAANWNNDTTNLYTVATPSGAVNGFAANKFTLNDANFSNDLAGGVFSIEEGSLKLKFMPNHAPTALDWTNNRAPGLSIKIKITNLLAQAASDVDGDGVAFVGVGSSTNGAAISTNGTYIFYSSTNNLTEAIAFTVRDVRSYRAGDTVRTATAYLYITAEAPAGTNGNAVDISFTNGVVGMRFAGIPGYAYEIQRATNLTPPVAWTTLHSTNAPTEGLFDFIDLTPPVGSAYYRTAQP